MSLHTALTDALGLRVCVVQGGMQWVGRPRLAAAVSSAGGLGMITALTQPSPQDLRKAIREAHSLLKPGTRERSKYGAIGVNITLLPSINPPDYEGYARAALEEGIRIFETAGNAPTKIIKLLKEHGAYVIHKCTQVRHAVSSQKMGVDCLSIDGFECAGHPGEMDVGGLVLLARAKEELTIPFIASGGMANGDGLAAALALGCAGINMGTRFMCTVESEIHPRIKQCIVDATENDTVHLFRTMKNTARVYSNAVAREAIQKERAGAKFEEIQHLVSGARGRTVYETGDPEAGVWSAGITLGLIHDVPTCEELINRIEREAIQRIESLARLVQPQKAAAATTEVSRESKL